jgi:LPXTG-motif cell wall-anchored protein
LAALALGVGAFAPAASAAEDILVIPIGGTVRGTEGELVNIGSVAVPADLVGATCRVQGQTRNQISVHNGNDLLITTGGQTFVVPDFEDAGFITHEAGKTEPLGPTVQLQVRLGPDGLSSGGFRVSIDCSPTPPATTVSTTTPEPSTTAPATTDTTTPGPPGTETAAPTSMPEPSGPEVTTASTEVQSTEPAPTSSPSTTSPSETTAPPTSASPTSAPTTSAPTSEPPPAGPTAFDDDNVGADLPATGSSTGTIVGAGLALIGAGLATRRFSRSLRRPDDTI